jgi:hypothetical protein
MIKLNLSNTLPCVVSLVTAVTVVAPAFAAPFKLRADQTDSVGGPKTTLDRSNLHPTTDPFASSAPQVDQAMDPGGFQLQAINSGGAPPPFNLQAGDSGGGDLQSQNAMPAQEEAPMKATVPQRFTPQDIDSTPDMQIAWDEWHKRVGAAVFSRFNMMAMTAFPRSRPMAAVAAYTVSRTGQIMNVRLTEKNFNPIYNAIVITAIQQLNGDLQTLQFPQGSRRMSMDQVGTFIHNNAADPNVGFKTLKGDHETIHPGQQRR